MVVLLTTGCNSKNIRKIDLSDRVSDAELQKMGPKHDDNILRFGFDLRSSPREDAQQYIPFLNYLEKATGLHIELRFTPANSTIEDDLGQGVVQFAAIGAVTYITANTKYGIIPLVRGLNTEGRAEYQSVIIVSPDSPIRKIEDLHGSRFAFGSITSTQGHLIPRIILTEHGISLNDLAEYKYTGSHHNCANAVAAGLFDAGGIQDTMGRWMAAEGIFHIIYTSQFYPSSGIAANRDVQLQVIKTIRQALLDFKPKGKDAENLYHWDRTEMPNGFTEANDEDYTVLREWILKFDQSETPQAGEGP
jgi:phosphonate transport system substrate-binding protein